jgi:L-fuconolactonase
MTDVQASSVARVDAHQHFWDLASGRYDWPTEREGPIFRSFGPADLAPELRAAGMDRTILVQTTDSTADTDSMLDVAARHGFVGGVVGWLPLRDAAALESELERLDGRLCGVRHLVHREADPAWLLRPDVGAGLERLSRVGLPFDVVAVFPDHLALMPEVARRHPDLLLVIDHLAKPPYRADGWDTWSAQIRTAAAAPNVRAKVSGLDTAAGPGWTVDELRPAFEVALDAFGPERLLFGTDWPVCRLVSAYGDVVRAAEQLIGGLSPDEQARIMGGTATEVYGIAPAGGSSTPSD